MFDFIGFGRFANVYDTRKSINTCTSFLVDKRLLSPPAPRRITRNVRGRVNEWSSDIRPDANVTHLRKYYNMINRRCGLPKIVRLTFVSNRKFLFYFASALGSGVNLLIRFCVWTTIAPTGYKNKPNNRNQSFRIVGFSICSNSTDGIL